MKNSALDKTRNCCIPFHSFNAPVRSPPSRRRIVTASACDTVQKPYDSRFASTTPVPAPGQTMPAKNAVKEARRSAQAPGRAAGAGGGYKRELDADAGRGLPARFVMDGRATRNGQEAIGMRGAREHSRKDLAVDPRRDQVLVIA